MSQARVHALVPAAGSSQRFGPDIPKQYHLLGGRPVLSHSIGALRGHPRIVAVHVVLAPGDPHFDPLVAADFPDIDRVEGGASRAGSVLNGLRHIEDKDPECDWVLVHDAARPCLSRSALDRLLNQALSCADGGILAIPLVDTIKRGEQGRIRTTVDRRDLWAAQTPQLFPIRPLAQALSGMLNDALIPTDEASVMEHAGYSPLLVEGERSNIKITHAADLAMAEFYLERRQAGLAE